MRADTALLGPMANASYCQRVGQFRHPFQAFPGLPGPWSPAERVASSTRLRLAAWGGSWGPRRGDCTASFRIITGLSWPWGQLGQFISKAADRPVRVELLEKTIKTRPRTLKSLSLHVASYVDSQPALFFGFLSLTTHTRSSATYLHLAGLFCPASLNKYPETWELLVCEGH